MMILAGTYLVSKSIRDVFYKLFIGGWAATGRYASIGATVLALWMSEKPLQRVLVSINIDFMARHFWV